MKSTYSEEFKKHKEMDPRVLYMIFEVSGKLRKMEGGRLLLITVFF